MLILLHCLPWIWSQRKMVPSPMVVWVWVSFKDFIYFFLFLSFCQLSLHLRESWCFYLFKFNVANYQMHTSVHNRHDGLCVFLLACNRNDKLLFLFTFSLFFLFVFISLKVIDNEKVDWIKKIATNSLSLCHLLLNCEFCFSLQEMGMSSLTPLIVRQHTRG